MTREPRDGTLTDAVLEFLGALQAAGVRFAPIRHREIAPEEIHEGDFDYLIDRRQRATFLDAAITALADRRHLFLLHNPAHPYSRKTTARIYDPQADAFATLEFWQELIWRRRRLYGALRWEELSWALVEADESYVLRPSAGALLYIAHLHAKRKRLATPLVRERLARYGDELAAPSASDPLAAVAAELVSAVQAGQLGVADANARALALLLRHSGVRPARAMARLQLRRLCLDYPRMLGRRLTRRSVAVVGPDGSGKSTLVEGLVTQGPPGQMDAHVFKRFFRDRIIYKILIRVRVGRNREKRNVWDEKVGAWLVALALPAYVRNLTRAGRRTLLLDRYFYDFLMLGVREPPACSGTAGAHRILLLHIIPTPGLVLNPLAKHEDTTMRRDALSAEGFRSYQRQLVALVSRRPPEWFAHIPTCYGVEECAAFALKAVRRAGLAGGLGRAQAAAPTSGDGTDDAEETVPTSAVRRPA